MKNTDWQLIETAPLNQPILILYYKGGKGSRTRVSGEWVITQARGAPVYRHMSNTWNEPYYRTANEPWDNCTCEPTNYVEWSDHLDRLIVNTSSKVIKNKVAYWMPLPDFPEDLNL